MHLIPSSWIGKMPWPFQGWGLPSPLLLYSLPWFSAGPLGQHHYCNQINSSLQRMLESQRQLQAGPRRAWRQKTNCWGLPATKEWIQQPNSRICQHLWGRSNSSAKAGAVDIADFMEFCLLKDLKLGTQKVKCRKSQVTFENLGQPMYTQVQVHSKHC